MILTNYLISKGYDFLKPLACDGVTDDTEAVQQRLDYGLGVDVKCCLMITKTLVIKNKSASFSCKSAGKGCF